MVVHSVRSGGWGSVLDGGADGHVADFDVVGLFDGEGDRAGDGFGGDAELGHPAGDLIPDGGVVDGAREFGADVPGGDRRRAQDPVGRLLAQGLEQGADRVLRGPVTPPAGPSAPLADGALSPLLVVAADRDDLSHCGALTLLSRWTRW